ncbi:hypothetical protein AVEN_143840-1 [Araneus ventricosus]|uniref:Retrovirus-related Pol polyprotein from transposon TNT 1-94-like beta-barrel domain-containing protein n=2 Tax=Araneus ventricosus TaxID=182803 RepID=A0A4Y2WN11_ARAVE|nr:hypothetical protein AVEN_143840-1 [Araneus ventricosus]
MDLAKVQIKPLAGESDWQVWKYIMKFILNCHADVLEVVQGTRVKPEVLTAGAEEATRVQYEKDLKSFQKANTNAMVALTNSMTEETLQKTTYVSDSRKAGTSSAAVTFGLMSVDEVYASEILSDTWHIDNDAYKHITMNEKFIQFGKFQSSHGITPAKGKVLPALGKGTLPTVTVVNKKQFKKLKDVWYVSL